ncbi:uncharacterized protein HMPREF1541_01064 [Cyphellophora europaea CBS 101466]|uniref:PI-PLC Y-box domain-containing protein n=1 Tax=Cyphellophora europaea (strain CBS 101466) TaxID=1220924 RepID=W2SE42_CYPE1|nr:uncharacterized protein HMPREF1541_01064 [Cyphellophora europaea CBS 101466]ETN46875.1 hypothetical protein HMPREF1541_01064 [Cyphellophora europaea CBS 101466]
MPETPRTPRRTSTARRDAARTQETAAAPPKTRPHTMYESSSVQDRIRQWQAQGAANALDPDALSVRSIPRSNASAEASRATTPVAEPPKSVPIRQSRWTVPEVDAPSKDRGSRSSSAPRKRVISDDHWKAKMGSSPGSPRTVRQKDIVTPHYDMTYTSTKRREEREAKRERRRRDRLSKDNAADLDRVSAHDAPKDLNAYIDQELAERLATTPETSGRSPEPSPEIDEHLSEHSFMMNDDLSHTISPSKYADTLGQPSVRNSKRSTKGGRILDKTREIFNKTDTPPVSNRIPSIQAWLEEQPDPFVEHDIQPGAALPEVEVPKPLKRGSRRTRPSSVHSPPDPNKIWESVTTYRARDGKVGSDPISAESSPRLDSSERHQQDHVSASRPAQHGADGSPSALRRRVAGRTGRRQKSETSTRQVLVEDVKQVSRSSSIQEDHPGQREKSPASAGQLQLSAISSGEASKDFPPPAYEDEDRLAPLEGPGLKRKLTTHEDLMSVLSLPMHRRSTRSRRIAKALPPLPAAQILEGLVAEEAKYVKELRTLVDGVVPVLLQAVLSKSSSIAAAGLFTNVTDPSDFSFTKPIIDMGIALERLKSLHSRIPIQNIDALLAWALNAQRAYGDYIKAWRLGFHDVVVNLEPLNDGQETVDPGMARDADGDVVDATGEKADVAFLLKRPLVRVKNLAKTFESIKVGYDKTIALEVAQGFADLTASARQRHREEQARLEDEAASALDASRTRNIRTLGALTGMSLNKSRKVRARDGFDLTLWHSTGQRLDCQVELIFRDNPPGTSSGGDVLICEIDAEDKWLLFPPVELASISARRGEDDVDLVVMIRGPSGIGQEWHELLALKSDDAEAVNEWMTMLGSCPLPPRLNRTRSFLERRKEEAKAQSSRPSTSDSKADDTSQTTVSTQYDVPLGEPSVVGAKEETTPKSRKPLLERFVPRLNLGGGLQTKQFTPRSPPGNVPQRKPVPSALSSDKSSVSDQSLSSIGKHAKVASAPTTPPQRSGPKSPKKSLKSPVVADDYMMSGALPVSANSAGATPQALPSDAHRPTRVESGPDVRAAPESEKVKGSGLGMPLDLHSAPERPGYARSLSATPSEGLPSIPKLRGKPHQERPKSSTPLTDSIRDQWMSLSGTGRSGQQLHETTTSQLFTEDIPPPPTPSKEARPQRKPRAENSPLPTPPHREGSGAYNSAQNKAMDKLPKLSPKSEQRAKRRSSSPLKHEYAPSTASESSSESDSDDASDSSSVTSDDFMSEVKDMATPLVAVTAGNRRASQFARPPPSTAPPTNGTRTLAPSDSASQGPYRRVPSSTTVPSNQTSRAIALICSWSDRGMWEQVHPDECSIVVSPGLIEAFRMSAEHSGPGGGGGAESEDSQSQSVSADPQPLVAFELTPIVPLRRGTALDINIRSPPTSNSSLRTTNNIMFRSRNADECDLLYGMINWARCNNPTYIQLEKARPKQSSVSFNVGPAQQGATRSSSWFGFGGSQKKSSFRASSAPMSVGGDTEASHSTVATAFSALKRLSASTAFSLNRSSVTRRSGWSRTSGSLYSSNSGTGSGSGSSTPIPSQVGLVPGRDGPNVPGTSAEAASGGGMVNNMKIRLYVRKGQNWGDLGSGRLSVLPALDAAGQALGNGASEISSPTTTPVRGLPGSKGPRLASSGHTPHRVHGDGREKRIVVRKNNKKNTEVVLLDAVLGESCFERVMQTGIAMKVWTEHQGVAHTGGVMMGREQIYMMQFPGVREAGWVFGLVGSYRYGAD